MEKKNSKQLTNKEWYIMKVLWGKSPKTLMELVEELGETMNWSKSTCATMIRRMTEKEIVGYRMDGKTKQFYPLVKKEDVIMPETNNFLQRIYDGSVRMFMNTLISQGELSDSDIDELEEMLRQAKKQREE